MCSIQRLNIYHIQHSKLLNILFEFAECTKAIQKLVHNEQNIGNQIVLCGYKKKPVLVFYNVDKDVEVLYSKKKKAFIDFVINYET